MILGNDITNEFVDINFHMAAEDPIIGCTVFTSHIFPNDLIKDILRLKCMQDFGGSLLDFFDEERDK